MTIWYMQYMTRYMTVHEKYGRHVLSCIFMYFRKIHGGEVVDVRGMWEWSMSVLVLVQGERWELSKLTLQ